MIKRLFVVMLSVFLINQSGSRLAMAYYPQADDKPIPYQITSNKVNNDIRHIGVLIDEGNFSVDNLKTLMKHFFAKYPNPDTLHVFIATERSQLYDMSTGEGEKPGDLHPFGGLHRKGENEFIRYKYPRRKLETIIVKGKDWISGK